MLTKKQELFFNLIVNCYYEEKKYPNLKTLKQKSNYKSYNTIYKYINQLENKGYIKKNAQKEIIYIKESLFNDPFLNIPIINEKQTIILPNSFFKTGKEYIGFQIHDNKLNSYCLKNGDILIIEKNKSKLNNKLVLVSIDNKYYILKCLKKDGFIHLLNDKDSFVLNSFKEIIGKVCFSIRTKF